jgi:protein-tyrosine phosphatase
VGTVTSPDGADTPFGVLFVCTGNICRSPMGDRLLAAGLRKHFGDEAAAVDVRSAGTWGRDGAPMEEYAAEAVIERGGDPSGFAARELRDFHVGEAGLVLGATRDHRAAAVTMVPRASAWTFTLPEFARLAAAVDASTLPRPLAERFPALVKAAAAKRGLVRPASPDDDDVKDPYGRSREVFAVCADAVAGPVDQILAVLAAR